jgi:hypothetical protein
VREAFNHIIIPAASQRAVGVEKQLRRIRRRETAAGRANASAAIAKMTLSEQMTLAIDLHTAQLAITTGAPMPAATINRLRALYQGAARGSAPAGGR